jgi:hypothetical protein
MAAAVDQRGSHPFFEHFYPAAKGRLGNVTRFGGPREMSRPGEFEEVEKPSTVHLVLPA